MRRARLRPRRSWLPTHMYPTSVGCSKPLAEGCSEEPIFCETDDEVLDEGTMDWASSLSASMPLVSHQTVGNKGGAGGAITASDSNAGKRKRDSDAEGMKGEGAGQARTAGKSPVNEGGSGAEDSNDCGWSAISTTEDSDDEGWNAIASKQRQMMKQRIQQHQVACAAGAGQPGWSFLRYQKGQKHNKGAKRTSHDASLPKRDSFYVLGPNGKETCYLAEKLRGLRCQPGDRLLFCRPRGQKRGFFARDEGGSGSRAGRAGGVPGGAGGVGGARSEESSEGVQKSAFSTRPGVFTRPGDGTKAVSFGFTFKCKNGVWKAEKIKLGGWAAQSGLVRKGDVIDSVDGVVCKGLDPKGFTRLMVGSEGSRASFVLRREGKEFHAVGIRICHILANTKPGPEDMTKATSADNPWNVIDHCEKGVQPPAHNEMADVKDSLCVEDARAEGHKRCVAVDCEMVGAGKFKNKNMLARVAVVDEHGTCLLNTFVRPCKPVTDYRTQWSGIRECDLQGAPALASVRARCQAYPRETRRGPRCAQ